MANHFCLELQIVDFSGSAHYLDGIAQHKHVHSEEMARRTNDPYKIANTMEISSMGKEPTRSVDVPILTRFDLQTENA